VNHQSTGLPEINKLFMILFLINTDLENFRHCDEKNGSRIKNHTRKKETGNKGVSVDVNGVFLKIS
jgi:hypothetical protein